MTFNIGDKVKIINSNIRPELIGKIAKIVYIDDPRIVVIGLFNDPERKWVTRREFLELIPNNIPINNINSGHTVIEKTYQPKINYPNANPGHCKGCNKFNDYQVSSYICYECNIGV